MNLQGQPIDQVVGQRMMNLLWHRGPEGDGSYTRPVATLQSGPTIFLGHRRLKILDLSDAAQQPLSNEDETVWVVFNGEAYNFQDLRGELQRKGHRFRSRSDTETIVHAYEEFGEEFVERLDGMFAFGLWDVRRGRLILARDRSGKKPLFYSFDGAFFTFASEIKALLACPWVERAVAVEHIPEYLTYGYVPSPRTFYRGILQVPMGSYLVVDSTGVSGPYRYWEVRFAAHHGESSLSPHQAAQRVRTLLTEAVARRLVSDVPLGALLSGGLDSSIVVGIMSQLLDEPVRTFTIGFTDDPTYDERPYAAVAARHFKTDHTEFVIRADAVSLMERLLWHHDQPYGDSSAISTYLVCKLARQHVTVALNGDGGDEVFAGYNRFLAAILAERMPRFLAPAGKFIAHRLSDGHGYYSLKRRVKRFFDDAYAPVQDRFAGWLAIFPRPMLKKLLRPEVMAVGDEKHIYISIDECYGNAEGLPLLHQLLYLNFMTYLPDDLHVKMDRMSMASSLETRSPMLDTALVEFVALLPPGLKIRRGVMKYILRLAFQDMLPPDLLKHKKHGFCVPLSHWFRQQLRPYVEELLLEPNARLKAYVVQTVIRTLFQEHISGVRDHGDRLWTLLTFELWLRMVEEGRLWQPSSPDIHETVEVPRVSRHTYA
jgi:asparagine synthase (glutamine-hydrolysing)